MEGEGHFPTEVEVHVNVLIMNIYMRLIVIFCLGIVVIVDVNNYMLPHVNLLYEFTSAEPHSLDSLSHCITF